ncbi:hypothetical protein GCM10022402_04180 [Salinactinospora qingdaonensis]|uniref:Uncharacterized protein n=1 Tax=Salinactinospora qingdaonensis TaxID=702744 RepID=A0ABP7EWT7_9ACTN
MKTPSSAANGMFPPTKALAEALSARAGSLPLSPAPAEYVRYGPPLSVDAPLKQV